MLLGLRRYAEAQRHFPAAERPLEWALCAAKLGHHGDAARVLSESGRPVLAALELEAAGASAAARLEWERVLADPRLGGRPYETALGHFNLGEALLRIGDRKGPRAPSRERAAPAGDGGRRLRDPWRAGARVRLLQRAASPRQGDGLVRERLRGLPQRDSRPGRRGPAAGDAVLRRLSDLRHRPARVVRGGHGGARGRQLQPAGRASPTIATTWASPSRPGPGPRATTRPTTVPSICRPTRSTRRSTRPRPWAIWSRAVASTGSWPSCHWPRSGEFVIDSWPSGTRRSRRRRTPRR